VIRVLNRRSVLSLLIALASAGAARANIIFGGQPFRRTKTPPPLPVDVGAPWTFFTGAEAATVEAIVDRLIPADDLGIGGRDGGCAVFIDRQLAGGYGKSVTWYLAGPAANGTPQQGPQFIDTIADRYRAALAALDRHCRAQFDGRPFAALGAEHQDTILRALESATLTLEGVDGKVFFEQILSNTREGFFADPLYGGNRDMAGWKMIGFPGARYDYRDVIGRRGEDLKLAPVSLYDRKDT
jgi:gluconate 2-dehydrogenase gamma chain